MQLKEICCFLYTYATFMHTKQSSTFTHGVSWVVDVWSSRGTEYASNVFSSVACLRFASENFNICIRGMFFSLCTTGLTLLLDSCYMILPSTIRCSLPMTNTSFMSLFSSPQLVMHVFRKVQKIFLT